MSREQAEIRAFRQSKRLASIYESSGYIKKSAKVQACGRAYTLWVCHGCGQYCYLTEFRCGDRLCGMCARHRVSRLLESYGGVLKALTAPRMVTLSMRSRVAGELNSAVKELWDAFTRLRHRSVWKMVQGAIVSLEVTYNRRARTWHPHLHIVCDSGFIDWWALRAAWMAVSAGEGGAVWIQRCKAGWERELLKYITKVADLLKDVPALREFIGFARGKRFVRTYGTLYNCAVNREEVGGSPVCSGCGTPMTVEKRAVKFEQIHKCDAMGHQHRCGNEHYGGIKDFGLCEEG